jgi:hypothetical protein
MVFPQVGSEGKGESRCCRSAFDSGLLLATFVRREGDAAVSLPLSPNISHDEVCAVSRLDRGDIIISLRSCSPPSQRGLRSVIAPRRGVRNGVSAGRD